jgi:hypothetical protein
VHSAHWRDERAGSNARIPERGMKTQRKEVGIWETFVIAVREEEPDID